MLIKLEYLTRKYQFKLDSVLHLGGHHAEEAEDYNSLEAKEVIWVEASPEFNKVLLKNIADFKNHKSFNILVAEEEGSTYNFNITDNEGSSSMLEMQTHELRHPNVKNIDSIPIEGKRLDHLIQEERINIESFNFLNIDLQGAELIALKSLGTHLDSFSHIYLEVNLNYLYKNCPLLSDLDQFLYKNGFIRKELKTTHYGWGDAYYAKEESSYSFYLQKIVEAYSLQLLQKIKDRMKYAKVRVKKLIGYDRS